MSGLAAELRGARDWMKVATAWLVGVSGIRPYTWRMEEQTGVPYVYNVDSTSIREIRKAQRDYPGFAFDPTGCLSWTRGGNICNQVKIPTLPEQQ